MSVSPVSLAAFWARKTARARAAWLAAATDGKSHARSYDGAKATFSFAGTVMYTTTGSPHTSTPPISFVGLSRALVHTLSGKKKKKP